MQSLIKSYMAWLHTVLNPTKAAGQVEFEGFGTLDYTQSWIQRKQPVGWSLNDLVPTASCSIYCADFDGLGGC